jgi:hypothetical protein
VIVKNHPVAQRVSINTSTSKLDGAEVQLVVKDASTILSKLPVDILKPI